MAALLVLGHASGKGETSRLELSDLSTRSANVRFVERGKVRRIVLYNDSEWALADLRLAEKAIWMAAKEARVATGRASPRGSNVPRRFAG